MKNVKVIPLKDKKIIDHSLVLAKKRHADRNKNKVDTTKSAVLLKKHDYRNLALEIRKTMGGNSKLIKKVNKTYSMNMGMNIAEYCFNNMEKIQYTLYYLHGGALLGGNYMIVENFLQYVAYLLGNNWKVVSLNYPLMPENDIQTIIAKIKSYIINDANNEQTATYLSGDSSGGLLAKIIHPDVNSLATALIYPQSSLKTEYPMEVFDEVNVNESVKNIIIKNSSSMSQLITLQKNILLNQGTSYVNQYIDLSNRYTSSMSAHLAELDGLTADFLQSQVEMGYDEIYLYRGTEHAFIDYFGYDQQSIVLAHNISNWLKKKEKHT